MQHMCEDAINMIIKVCSLPPPPPPPLPSPPLPSPPLPLPFPPSNSVSCVKPECVVLALVHTTLSLIMPVCDDCVHSFLSRSTCSSGLQQSLLVTETVQDTGTDWLEYVDPNEPRYCLCNQVSQLHVHVHVVHTQSYIVCVSRKRRQPTCV